MSAGAPGGQRAGSTARTIAQAKVNLFLRILAREENGYHQIETLFCRLDLGDEVMVRTNVHGRSLDCTGDTIPAAGLGPTEKNLAWRAAVAYAEATGWPNAWAIDIEKRIPVGGGLGGGSADAGAVLRCLNAISPTPLALPDLVGLAAPLGADVPFLTTEAPLALGWGRGERMLALPPLPDRPVALVTFPFGVPTRDAYAWVDESRSETAVPSTVVSVEALTTWLGVSRLAHNDFESVVATRHPAIASALADLRSVLGEGRDTFSIVQLSGSGATVFMISLVLTPSMFEGRAPVSRILHTRTATRVVAVEVSD